MRDRISLPSGLLAHELLTSFQNATKWRYICKSTSPLPGLFCSSVFMSPIPTSQTPAPGWLPGSQRPFSVCPTKSPKARCLFHTLIWSDRQSNTQALGPEVCDTAHTTHIRGLAYCPRQIRCFWETKQFAQIHPKQRKTAISTPP